MKKQLIILIILSVAVANPVLGQFKLDATGSNDMRLRTNSLDRMNILTKDRKSTRLNSSHPSISRMPSSA